MKNWIYLIFLGLGLMGVSTTLNAQNNWIKVFEDEFDQVNLDQTVWDDDMHRYRDGHPYFYWSPYPGPPGEHDVFEMTGSTIKMYIDEVPSTFTAPGQPHNFQHNFWYILAGMETWETYKEGYFETRFRISEHGNMFPAFWTVGEPGGGEVDIFEINTEFPKRVATNIHNWNSLGNFENAPYKNAETYCQSGQPTTFGCAFSSKFSNGFHTMGFMWTEFQFSWYVDGNLIRTVSRVTNPVTTDQQRLENLFTYRQKVILNMGGNEYDDCVDTVINGQQMCVKTPFLDMDQNFLDQFDDIDDNPWVEFDYVKIWKLQLCDKDIDICNYSAQDNDMHKHPRFFYGRNITAGGTNCTVTVENSGYNNKPGFMELRGTQSVSLRPGFSVKAGSHFLAEIVPCSASQDQPDAEFTSRSSRKTEQEAIMEAKSALVEPYKPASMERLPGKVALYPNPTQGRFSVLLPLEFSGSATVSVRNLMGQTVLEQGMEAPYQEAINLEGQIPGVYMVSITAGPLVKTIKLVLE